MIRYEDFPLSSEILAVLKKYEINYVFQPIFYADGKRIFAYEALMRPVGPPVTQLIEEFEKKGQLHILEVITFWGAAQAYFERDYKEKLSVNSFPCEVFSEEEARAYIDYF